MIKEYDDFEAAYNKMQELIKNEQEGILYGLIDKTIILRGMNDHYFNEDKGKSLGIPIYNVGYLHHGIIVGFPGDVAFITISKDAEHFINDTVNLIVEYLKSRNLNVEIVDNDIIVDGDKKVGAFTPINVGKNLSLGAVYVGINVDADLIQSVSTKFAAKNPTPLNESYINGKEIIDYITTHSKYFNKK